MDPRPLRRLILLAVLVSVLGIFIVAARTALWTSWLPHALLPAASGLAHPGPLVDLLILLLGFPVALATAISALRGKARAGHVVLMFCFAIAFGVGILGGTRLAVDAAQRRAFVVLGGEIGRLVETAAGLGADDLSRAVANYESSIAACRDAVLVPVDGGVNGIATVNGSRVQIELRCPQGHVDERVVYPAGRAGIHFTHPSLPQPAALVAHGD